MRKHILVAEDDSQIRYSVCIMLRKAGCRITEADNGRAALSLILDAVKNDNLDLLILDIEMPHMSGTELMNELKRRGISIPTVAVSGSIEKQLTAELLHLGCAGILHKPFGPSDVLGVLRSLWKDNDFVKNES